MFYYFYDNGINLINTNLMGLKSPEKTKSNRSKKLCKVK